MASVLPILISIAALLIGAFAQGPISQQANSLALGQQTANFGGTVYAPVRLNQDISADSSNEVTNNYDLREPDQPDHASGNDDTPAAAPFPAPAPAPAGGAAPPGRKLLVAF